MTDATHTEDFEFPGDIDLEKLRSELIELSERGEIKHTKVFLSNKKKCTESVMKQIMAEYIEKRQKQSKSEFAVVFVTLLPSLLEKAGVHFRGGHESFSSKVLADENTMFVIADMMPACDGGGYYFKYFSALIFLSSLCYNNISFGEQQEQQDKSDEVPEPEKTEGTE